MFLKCYHNTDCFFLTPPCVVNPKRNRWRTFMQTPFHFFFSLNVHWSWEQFSDASTRTHARTRALEDGGGSLVDRVARCLLQDQGGVFRMQLVGFLQTSLEGSHSTHSTYTWLMKYLSLTAPLMTHCFPLSLQYSFMV